jgi:hypothetical protein
MDMCWIGHGTSMVVWNNGEFLWSNIPSHKMVPIKFGSLYYAYTQIGDEADFTRDQKEGHFTKPL